MGAVLGSWSERAGWERAIHHCSLGERKGPPPAWPLLGGWACPAISQTTKAPALRGRWHCLGSLGGP